MRFEWPRWVWWYRIGRTRIRVYPTGLAALFRVQYILGLALLWMLPMWVAILTPEPIIRATLEAMRLNLVGAAFYLLFAMLCTAVHELGHVVGAQLAETPAKSFVLGSHGRIFSEPPATPGGLLLLKGSGPVAALAYGCLLLIAATAVTTSVGAAGVWAVGTAVANLLPLPPANSDGMSSWRAVRALLAGDTHTADQLISAPTNTQMPRRTIRAMATGSGERRTVQPPTLATPSPQADETSEGLRRAGLAPTPR